MSNYALARDHPYIPSVLLGGRESSMTRAIPSNGRTTKVSLVAVIAGINRDIVVREYADPAAPNGVRMAVVDPAYHRPRRGYNPLLTHYTQGSLNTVRKTADEDAYANSRLANLLAKRQKVQGNARGTKFLTPYNLFSGAVHMLTVGGPDEWNTVPQIRAFLVSLAWSFGIECPEVEIPDLHG